MSRLYEALRTGRFVLLTADPSEAAALDGRVVDAVDVHAVADSRATVVPPLILVRPDAHIAWATDEPDRGHRRMGTDRRAGSLVRSARPVRDA